MTQDFRDALVKFVAEIAQGVINDHCNANGYPISTLTISEGKKYTKVIREEANGGQRSVHCFIDNTSGDILKPASFRAPAKHARGNIFNPDCGLEACTPWGIRYLK